jgi:mono/diheme cytochrome c family protein
MTASKYSLALVAATGTLLLSMTAGYGADSQSFAQIERGRYLAVAADCAACHTKPDGKPYAGGVALPTPFGTLVAPNITPDRDGGIGAWTDDEFVSALREGRGRHGKRLYPAMPYPAYTKLSTSDALAIRAYLQTIDPVADKVESNQLPFPFSIRAVMSVWNLLNFTPERLTADPSRSPEWNRGRYLVDALGHCGTCHTPKNFLGADKTSNYLEGGSLLGWYAPNITGDARKGLGSWPDQEVFDYLKTGTTARTMASGPMAEVVEKSTSHLSDDDIKAMVAYLKNDSTTTTAAVAPAAISPNDHRMVAGQAIFADNCAGCHTASGAGAPRLFPKLAGNSVVQSDNPTTLIRIILQGTQGASTAGAPTSPAMPSLGWRLNDDQVASVVTYIRNSWGNSASAASASDVAKLRAGP